MALPLAGFVIAGVAARRHTVDDRDEPATHAALSKVRQFAMATGWLPLLRERLNQLSKSPSWNDLEGIVKDIEEAQQRDAMQVVGYSEKAAPALRSQPTSCPTRPSISSPKASAETGVLILSMMGAVAMVTALFFDAGETWSWERFALWVTGTCMLIMDIFAIRDAKNTTDDIPLSEYTAKTVGLYVRQLGIDTLELPEGKPLTYKTVNAFLNEAELQPLRAQILDNTGPGTEPQHAC